MPDGIVSEKELPEEIQQILAENPEKKKKDRKKKAAGGAAEKVEA